MRHLEHRKRNPVPRLMVVALLASMPLVAHAQGEAPAPPPDTLLTPINPQPAATPLSGAATTPATLAAPAPVPQPAASADTSFTFPLLFDLRTRDEIQRELDGLARMRAAAQDRVSMSRSVQTRRKYDAEIKGTEIDAAKKRVELAKKEKRAADAKSLDDARKQLEAQKDFLEKLRDRAAADAEFQLAALDYAATRAAQCQAELAVLALGDVTNPDTRGSTTGRAAQFKLNDAYKARAGAGATLADREKSLCDRRKAAYDAWARLAR